MIIYTYKSTWILSGYMRFWIWLRGWISWNG